jgi:hypothetical protein
LRAAQLPGQAQTVQLRGSRPQRERAAVKRDAARRAARGQKAQRVAQMGERPLDRLTWLNWPTWLDRLTWRKRLTWLNRDLKLPGLDGLGAEKAPARASHKRKKYRNDGILLLFPNSCKKFHGLPRQAGQNVRFHAYFLL